MSERERVSEIEIDEGSESEGVRERGERESKRERKGFKCLI